MQVEKVKQEKERVEKVKVGDKTYDARVDAYKTKVKAGGMDFESRITVWRTAGALLSVELRTIISVICMVNGNNIQRPR